MYSYFWRTTEVAPLKLHYQLLIISSNNSKCNCLTLWWSFGSTVESSALTELIVGFWLSIFWTVIGRFTVAVLPAASATVIVLALVAEPKEKSA